MNQKSSFREVPQFVSKMLTANSGTCGQGQAARILSQLALDPVGNVEPAVASADDYMRLVVYHLLGALFAPPAQSRAPTPSY